jgi:antitoxin (DNA-binding transcriptional repressor) of toxin-antitoxin stability system
VCVKVLPDDIRRGIIRFMTVISIHELHENTDLWVRKAAEEPVVLTDNGQAVAKIVPLPVAAKGKPFGMRQLLPGFAELQAKLSGGTDSTQIISEMRDGR